MILGLLPALGGSIAELSRLGQDSRLIDGYLSRYVRAFDHVTYFSYAPEHLADYARDQGGGRANHHSGSADGLTRQPGLATIRYQGGG